MILMCLQLLVLECMLYPCVSESINLTSSEGIDNGKWVLEERSSATLLCRILSYAGQMVWLFNSLKVAECTFTYCRQISTGDGSFMFGFDTMNGVFEWTINAVDNAKHNGQEFACFDGTNASNVTAVVKEIARNRNDSDESNIVRQIKDIGIAAITIACTALMLIIVLIILIKLWERNEAKKKYTAKTQEMNDNDEAVKSELNTLKQQVDAHTQQLNNVMKNSIDKTQYSKDMDNKIKRIEKLEQLLGELQAQMTNHTNELLTVKTKEETEHRLNENPDEVNATNKSEKTTQKDMQEKQTDSQGNQTALTSPKFDSTNKPINGNNDMKAEGLQ